MKFTQKLEHWHQQHKSNQWIYLFSIFTRLVLAAGFLPSGYVKVVGERFTALANEHPMGAYLEALFHTGYYYTFIGIAQMLAAILLLIPRTVTLGALLYLPIILNICILSFSVRFDGSLFTAPLMVLATLFLLWWNYDKIKFLLPWKSSPSQPTDAPPLKRRWKFPWKFAGSALAMFTFVIGGVIAMNIYTIMPRNSVAACQLQFENGAHETLGAQFCDCIHNQGRSLRQCLDAYPTLTK
ncbi:DoxX family protein [Altibacter sp. HG106]|uniref:DoxX family protein n=1 Tax=Altibacter sp. HG106 TaxID=3023937 RepID=UPI0023507060|nr:DoxX family protein [Altibacter sp. HG106]MDC7995675.1 DoxX family protein [Altibacter sp. HG106]